MDSNNTLLTAPWDMVRNRTRQLGDTLCEIKEPHTYIFTAALIILSLVGTIKNTLVLIAMCKYKKLRSPTLFFIGALATIDLLTSAIVIPLYVVLALNPSASWHKASIIIMVVIVTLSILTAVYISVDRFAHVYCLQKYNMTRKKSILCLFLLWIIPFVLFFLVRWLVYKFAGRRSVRFATRGIAVVLITLCITTIVGSYTGILFLLQRHAKRMKDTMQSSYLDTQSRASKNALIIVVCVVLMNTPTLIYTILLLTGTETPTWFCTITLITLLGSSALNPMVYLLRIPDVREHVLKLICCRGKKDEEERVRLTSHSSTRTMSVTIVKNKDSLKLLKQKEQINENPETSAV